MNRVNQLLFQPKYQEELGRIERLEKDREFCRHGMEHFLDVARLAYIFCLEQGVNLEKEVVYAAALLHDLGRGRQYEEGIPHEAASEELAAELLPLCGFTEAEQRQIREAILGHRMKGQEKGGAMELGQLLYKADKRSRNCFACSAREKCHWPEEKMNLDIRG